ncbi:hypothetical protein B0T10DRAFT_84356 [Thelonectria olida]|uniref:DUF2293 domain-containing protein n=1 Tax=Thelonectria olida TaxID=1576542 RepID=A0A9P9AMZ5_9HYPO|nr:hypothetical protein B0T10DRAFT_84356 [Thelonectria olida]
MGREKRNLLVGQAGGAKERHKRAQRSQYDPNAPVPEGFVAKPALPKSKHQSYFEFVENKEKKKKLEHKITTDKTPPPGFEFVPIGNPELTTACKELSREKDAMIFIVSNSKEKDSNILAHQVHRVGHHIRETIVDEARASLGQPPLSNIPPIFGGSPEPIPKSQEEYNVQVDAAIRDLFPRIPNTDRQMIIEHAFNRGSTFKGEKPVGLSTDITLARRVQLAVLAHIRHTHTRYDNLLKETTWQNARKVVESLCLDTLVKWRGDEETGRDQLDEILREVVVISDSEDDDSDQDSDDSSVMEIEPPPRPAVPLRVESIAAGQAAPARRRTPKPANGQNGPLTPARAQGKVQKKKRKTSAEKKGQRGFKRYHAWQEAIRRYREENSSELQPAPMDRPPNPSYLPQHQPAPRPTAPYASHEFRNVSEPRISASIAGPAPTENGYVAQPPSYAHHAVNIARRSYSPLQRAPVHDKVMSPREVHRDSPGSRRPVSLVTNRLQDLLVPSIEPASPEAMRPSFVRTVPPRGQDVGNGSPRGSGMQYSPRRFSPPRGAPFTRGEPVVVARRVVQRERLAPAEAHADHRGHVPSVSRDQEYVSTRDGYPVSNSSVYHSDGLPYESSQLPAMAPMRRAPQDPLRSERPNTILMEDRGGFYERVSSHPDGAHPLPRTTRVVEFRQQPTHDIRRAPEPRRVVPLQEGPRILRDGRSSPGLRVIPTTTGAPSQPFDRQSRVLLAEPVLIRPRTPNEIVHGRGHEREYYPVYQQPPRPEPRPMSGGRVVVREEPYREVYVCSSSD